MQNNNKKVLFRARKQIQFTALFAVIAIRKDEKISNRKEKVSAVESQRDAATIVSNFMTVKMHKQ
jgi:hypothetical protein